MLVQRKFGFPALFGALLGLMLAMPVLAQRGLYGGPPAGRPAGGHVAGRFDYYALVLSWSPAYCASPRRRTSDPQCDRRAGRPFAFVLHGLWPQYERGYPEFCVTRDRPFVPKHVIDRMLDIMPSPRLVIHEYRRHGTCSGLDPASYFDLSRNLFAKVKIPPRYVNPIAPLFVGPAELMQEFVDANPSLKPDMIGIECRGPGNRLRAVRICFSSEGEFRACGANEHQPRLCSAERIYVPPVRFGAGSQSEPSRPSPDPPPLPGPSIKPPGQRSL